MWVYTVGQVVPTCVPIAIEAVLDVGSLPGKIRVEDGGFLQDIDIIVSARYTEETMPEAEVISHVGKGVSRSRRGPLRSDSRNCLQYHRRNTLLALVLPLVRGWAILPCPVHAVDASQHARKAATTRMRQYSNRSASLGALGEALKET